MSAYEMTYFEKLPSSPIIVSQKSSPHCMHDCVENHIAIFANSSTFLHCPMWLSTHLTIRWGTNRTNNASLRRDSRHPFRRRSLCIFPSTFSIKPQSFFDVIAWNQRLSFRMLHAGKRDRKLWSNESKTIDSINLSEDLCQINQTPSDKSLYTNENNGMLIFKPNTSAITT